MCEDTSYILEKETSGLYPPILFFNDVNSHILRAL